MLKKKLEDILEDCINMLREGATVSDCLHKYRRTRGLKQLLQTVQTGITIPKKQVHVNGDSIWQKISMEIEEPAWNVTPAKSSFLRLFHFAIPRSVAAVLVVLLVISLINVTAVAAKNSVSGETLYSVKKTVEKVELTLTLDDVKKTEVRIKHAEKRLEETKVVAEQTTSEDKKTKALEKTVTALVNTTSEITENSIDNKELLEKVVKLTDKQEAVLSDIEVKLTGKTKDVVTEAKSETLKNKAEAVEGLAKLNSTDTTSATGQANSTSTSTNPALPSNTATSTPNQASTTDQTLDALGDPATSTLNLLPPPPPNDTEISTPIIMQLN